MKQLMKRHCVPFAARGLPAVFALLALGCAAPALAAGKASRPDPDLMLIEVYKDLGARHLRDALAKADMLVAAYPNFQLGHLIRGDLLLMQTHEVDRFGAVNGAAPEALASLRQEASARLKALYERPDPALVPRAVLQLRRDQKKVLLVDARRSRLYVYENRRGQLRFERDFHISELFHKSAEVSYSWPHAGRSGASRNPCMSELQDAGDARQERRRAEMRHVQARVSDQGRHSGHADRRSDDRRVNRVIG